MQWKLLLVEDDEDDYLLARHILGTAECVWAATYEAGLQALEQADYDVILVDYYLGAKTGVEWIQAAQAVGCLGPFILLTGRDNELADEDALRVGATMYLTKTEIQSPGLLQRTLRYARERQQIEEALLQSNRQLQDERTLFQAVLQQMPSGVAIAKNSEKRYLLRNERMGEIFCHPIEPLNLSQPQLYSDDPFPIFYEDGRRYEWSEYPLARAISQGQSVRNEAARFYRADGTLGWLNISASPVRDEQGNIVSAVAVMDDVTERYQAYEAIHQQNELLASFLQFSPFVTFITRGPDHCYRLYNQVHAATAPITDLTGRPFRQVWTGDNEFADRLDEVYQSGQPVTHYDLAFTPPEGETRYFTVSITPLEDSQGQVDGLLVMGVETTEQVLARLEIERALEALRESEQRFRLMGETLPYGVWWCDAEGRAVYTSQSFLDLLEMTMEEMQGFGWTHRLPPNEVAPMLERWMHSVHTGKDWDDEHHVLGPDGRYHTVLTRGKPVRDKNGKILGWVGINLDIEERKQLEIALRRHAERAEVEGEVFQLLSGAGLDQDMVLQITVQRAAEILNCGCALHLLREDQHSFRLVAFAHPDPQKREAIEAYFEEQAEQPQTNEVLKQLMVNRRLILLPKIPAEWYGGLAFPFGELELKTMVIAPMRAEGQVLGVISAGRGADGPAFISEDLTFMQDLADRSGMVIHIARLVQELQNELSFRERAERELSSYARQLERSNQELEQFAFVASHDLQEPLRKIEVFSRQLQKRLGASASETDLDYMERMQNAANRMRRMTDDLLALSRVSTHGNPFQPVTLSSLLSAVLDDLSLRIRQSEAQVTVAPLPTVQGDPIQLHQLFQNLLVNAIKFHQPDLPPLISINGQANDGHVEIAVQDNGIGFEMEYAEQIFLPFHRLHGRTQYEGNGIGLSICRKIVERHGGQIWVNSVPGQGTTFHFTLKLS